MRRPRPQAAAQASRKAPRKARPDPEIACLDCGWQGRASAWAEGMLSDETGIRHPNTCPLCGGQSAKTVKDLHAEYLAKQGKTED